MKILETNTRTYFNSIKVRLKLEKNGLANENEYHFNSIKVRLKPFCFIHYRPILKTFQFHKGTIKTTISIR